MSIPKSNLTANHHSESLLVRWPKVSCKHFYVSYIIQARRNDRGIFFSTGSFLTYMATVRNDDVKSDLCWPLQYFKDILRVEISASTQPSIMSVLGTKENRRNETYTEVVLLQTELDVKNSPPQMKLSQYFHWRFIILTIVEPDRADRLWAEPRHARVPN